MTQWPELGKRLALWEAVYHGQEAKVQKLLSSPNGIQQVNIPHGLWQQTSLHLVVGAGNRKMLKALLFVNADTNARSINGTTPLHIAVEKCRKDLVQDLLLVGANPMLRNHTGKNAIQMAMDRGMKDVAVMLEQQAATLQFHAAQMDHARQQTQEKVQRTGATRPHESQAATPI